MEDRTEMNPQDHEIELEPHPDQPWCATCERWEESCMCPDSSLDIRAESPNESLQTDAAKRPYGEIISKDEYDYLTVRPISE